MMRVFRSQLACLDFGLGQLTFLQVANGAVNAWGSRPLPEMLLRNGDPYEPAALGEVVRQSLSIAGIDARRARMTIPDEATVSRQVTMPPMRRRDLARAMGFEAERLLPFPIERARWSWDVIERTPDKVKIYLAAAWGDVVDHYIEVARCAGLQPEVLEPRSLAVARAVDCDQALLIHGGAQRLHLTLISGGQPIFMDEQARGRTFAELRESLDQLLQRAFRYQSTNMRAASRMAPVLLAGDLESTELPLPVHGQPVTRVLNGHLPSAPSGFRAGNYLANLGLGARSRR
jgi:type IV pilus assembly protein PilM